MKTLFTTIVFLISIFCFSQNIHPDNNILLPGNSKKFTVTGARDSSIMHATIAGKTGYKMQLYKVDSTYEEGYHTDFGFPFWQGTKQQRFTYFIDFPSSTVLYDVTRMGIWDFHDMPDTILGEDWRSSPVQMFTQYDSLYLFVASSSKIINSLPGGNTDYDSLKIFNLGAIDKNSWHSWDVRVTFSYTSNGLVQLYKDGTMILNYSGANAFNDKNYPCLHFGIYKWPWYDQNSGSLINYIQLYFADPVVSQRKEVKIKKPLKVKI